MAKKETHNILFTFLLRGGHNFVAALLGGL